MYIHDVLVPSPQVAQVASKMLGVPLELIKIKPTDTMLHPNGVWTGASITSELNCLVSGMIVLMVASAEVMCVCVLTTCRGRLMHARLSTTV